MEVIIRHEPLKHNISPKKKVGAAFPSLLPPAPPFSPGGAGVSGNVLGYTVHTGDAEELQRWTERQGPKMVTYTSYRLKEEKKTSSKN